jgi:hypothetical protein
MKNRARISGFILHLLISALMIFTGLRKILKSVPPETLVKFGLGEQARLIGAGAILSALLLLLPRTALLGLLLTSSFWGGAICIHMAHGDAYLFPAVMLVLSWAGAYLRNPEALAGFSSGAREWRMAVESESALP